ncbi:Ubiquitin [Corchorus olitorius]|uniref:Ubiquitin n=1 Tax=Corchorus olitorius TaxID=93759 RepID=A0A1R3JWW1_9ROSI|nr:Ubiquitin [Corchorus olitorius]
MLEEHWAMRRPWPTTASRKNQAFISIFDYVEVVAVKRVKDVSQHDHFAIEINMLKEIEELGLVNSRCIKFMGSCNEADEKVILLEFMAGGTLYDRMHEKWSILTWPDRLVIAQDVAEALSSLHNHGILHRDIKSLNVLSDKDFRANISYFGVAVKLPESGSSAKARRVISLVERKFPFENPRLFYTGRTLGNEKTLAYYDIQKEPSIHLNFRLRGAMGGSCCKVLGKRKAWDTEYGDGEETLVEIQDESVEETQDETHDETQATHEETPTGLCSKHWLLVVVVKRVKDVSQHDHFATEINMLKEIEELGLVNSRCIKFMGSCDEVDEKVILLEFMAGGTLYDRMHDRLPMVDAFWSTTMKPTIKPKKKPTKKPMKKPL